MLYKLQSSTLVTMFLKNMDNCVRLLRKTEVQRVNCVRSTAVSFGSFRSTDAYILRRKMTIAQSRLVPVNAKASYAAPLEPSAGSSFIIRPLAEILRDLNKKVPDQALVNKPGSVEEKQIPWYQANRMLSFYAPGWCGEVRDIKFSSDAKLVTVIYRVTIRGADGEAFREASGTVSTLNTDGEDATQQAEQMAFVRACARFGLGLYLHHEQ
ncbi:hypothetical protein KP509_11G031300 [Ceratopteris richardii]|uniref:Uncharacterized protein n=1 Tax=Ceratopteris richardii TaxID=49495 RepID=A0A8T2TT75_CERRI|nr:hypothetical protein KP509_11G031300 [Ceratopteris richardii]